MLMTAQANAVALKAKLFRGFADPSRLSIVEALRAGPLTVSQIAAVTVLSQPNASNHLSCLRDCGLVVSEQQGRYVRYQLSDRRGGAPARRPRGRPKGRQRVPPLRPPATELTVAGQRTIEVPIRGMDCADCVVHVERAIAALPGVALVHGSLPAERAG